MQSPQAHDTRDALETLGPLDAPLSPEAEKALREAIQACRDKGGKGRVMSRSELLFDEDFSFEVPPVSPEEEKSLKEAIQSARDSGCKGIYLGSFAQFANDE